VRDVTRSRATWCLGAGLVVASAAVAGLEQKAETGLTSHMVQHVALMVVAAPLLALGAPRVLTLLPDGAQRLADSVGGRAWAVWAGAAVALQAGVMIAWHLPGPFETAVRHEPLHALEHLTLLGTSVLFWWVVFAGRHARVGLAVGAVFLTALVCNALGAAITLAGSTWYPTYRSLPDQQMAGVVMWSVAGAVYLLAAVGLFFAWLAGLERSSPGRLVTSA
jgi:putative membrane protein